VDGLDNLVHCLWGRRTLALTGAGVSTESGIPDYRGPTTRHRPRTPMQHRLFVSDARARARYWARSARGWPTFRHARPNRGHLALAALQRSGAVSGLLTQNVDRLHRQAGSQDVELHGALAEVRCLDCGALEGRDEVQRRLEALNPGLLEGGATLAPDGDVDVPEGLVEGFRVPECLACGGVLKPDVVFFGDAVPRPRLEAALALLEGAQALLVVGSSLTVFSGYRFVLQAAQAGKPVAIVNLGPTRGHPHACVTVDGSAGEVLEALAARLA
jgi:NAD+-dependent protein deacetylase sirtuin 4